MLTSWVWQLKEQVDTLDKDRAEVRGHHGSDYHVRAIGEDMNGPEDHHTNTTSRAYIILIN